MRLAESLDSDNVLQRHIAPLRQVAWRGHHGRSVGFVEVDQTVEVELGPGQWFIRVVGHVLLIIRTVSYRVCLCRSESERSRLQCRVELGVQTGNAKP
jgi:hypothetical protein